MKNKAFTLAETLIVIGIIGVVAALTLPNLNHATGDKETVTRLMKAYSTLNEAVDRAVAIYGPISTWKSCQEDDDQFTSCLMKRIGEFLKISKSCNEIGYVNGVEDVSCDPLRTSPIDGFIIYQLQDGLTFTITNMSLDCTMDYSYYAGKVNDVCADGVFIDINGPNKGKNEWGYDSFRFMLSDSLGLVNYNWPDWTFEDTVDNCLREKGEFCFWWILQFGNLDYLKADEEGNCNDSNIVLDGVTNTSCH